MQSFVESPQDHPVAGDFSQGMFQCAPPRLYAKQSIRSAPTPPFKGAPGHKCSVYYYWWRFLKLSPAYYKTCRQSGCGPCAKLYKDFGDIYQTVFEEWWQAHWNLFAEQPAAIISGNDGASDLPENMITVKIDLSRGKEAVRRSLEAIHLQIHYPERVQSTHCSTAKYTVFARPILMTLHRQLQIYKAKTQDPDAPDEDIADRVGITVNNKLEGLTERQMINAGIPTTPLYAQMRRAKHRVVQRDYRMACSLIRNAELGVFPKSDTR